MKQNVINKKQLSLSRLHDIKTMTKCVSISQLSIRFLLIVDGSFYLLGNTGTEVNQ